MRLAFLDREEELVRLRRSLSSGGGLAVLYARRRCGTSRLLLEAVPADHAAHYVADGRVGPLQRQALAVEVGRLIPGFTEVTYADWSTRPDVRRLLAEARCTSADLTLVRGREVHVGARTRTGRGRAGHFGPADVLRALR